MTEITFAFPLNVVIRFTDGDCGALAIQLKEVLGGQIYGLYPYLNKKKYISEPYHYVCRVIRNTDMFIDINGMRTQNSLVLWAKEMVPDLPTTCTWELEPVDDELSNPDYYREIVNNERTMSLAMIYALAIKDYSP